MMSGWLEKFANRIDLHWWYFALPGALVMITAILTVSGHMIHAARLNPSEVIKIE